MELAIPHLRILDRARAVAFYVDALGFEIEFEWRNAPDTPVYLGIARGTLRAHLSEHAASGPPGQGRGMTLAVDDVDAWYERLRERDLAFAQALETKPWGARDFIVHDPFENVIVVTSSVADAPRDRRA